MSTSHATWKKAHLPDPLVVYSVKFESKHLYCNIRVNDFEILNNLFAEAGVMNTDFSINEFLQNGSNTIGIEVDSMNWFDPEKRKLPFEEKAKFAHPDAYCQIKITADIKEKNNSHQEVVAILALKLNEEGKLIIDNKTYEYDYPASPKSTLNFSPIKRSYAVPQNVHYLSRTLNAKGVSDWSWINAPKYDDIPNNRQLLEEAYLELWHALNNKDINKLRELLDISIYEMTLGSSFSYDLLDDFSDYNFEKMGYSSLISSISGMPPFEPKQFTVTQLAQGRIVHLEYRDEATYETYPPVGFYVNGNEHVAKHYFAFINGKFRVVR